MQKPLSTSVSATEKVLIMPVVEHFDENADVCAINWFDLKKPWMYQLYGLIASRYVRKVSARLCFKGTLVKQLEGQEDRQRENLLIVCYPSARAFLDLVDFKIFQVTSVLRLAAVKRFCFGFTENLVKKTDCRGASDRRFNKQQIYLVHHFQAKNSWLRDNRQLVFNSAARHNMAAYFCGLTTAHIAREKSGQQQSTEFFMDGIVLFAANSQTDIENFIKADIYTTFKDKNSSNSLYLFSRTL